MDVYLIRHAHAGDRQQTHHDRYRPLSERGETRSAELASEFHQLDLGVVLSSPATRCVQTVEPLAHKHGVEVEEHDDLFEGARIPDVLELLAARAGDRAVVACSHGDIIPEVIDHLGRDGVEITGRGCEKGSVWHLTIQGEQWMSARRWTGD